MKLVAFDLGALTGAAYFKNGSLVETYLFDCSIKRGESSGMKMVRFAKAVGALLDEAHPDFVAYEDWVAHGGVYAAQELGAFKNRLLELCEDRHINYFGLTVTAIKAHATGHPHASKEKMLKAATLLWPKHKFPTPDVADAAHIGRLALTKL